MSTSAPTTQASHARLADSTGEPFRDAALRELRNIPNHTALSYLELGCGDGFILERLRRDGVKNLKGTTYRSRTEDYIRGRDYPEAIDDCIVGGIDLNKPLPFGNAEFDVVYTTEVIEHVEGHRMFITEAARVLKPGGWFIITTPNVHRILSRLDFFLSGTHRSKMELLPHTTPVDWMEQWHQRCADFPLLHYLMWRGGLRVERIVETEVRTPSRWALMLRPVLAGPTRKAVYRHVRPDADDRAGKDDLYRWMMHPALLSSEQMCVVARKTGPEHPKSAKAS